MNLREEPSHAAFRQAARAWLESNVPRPLTFELVGTTADLDYRKAWARTLSKAGYAAIDWPASYGGGGLSLMERVIWNEEHERARAPETFENTWDNLGSTLLAHGTVEQCARYLPSMLTGDDVWCQGFSEPNSGSDLASLTTRASRSADGTWRLTGQKVWTSNARWSGWCYALARSDPAAQRHAGLTFFLVPMGQPGINLRPLRQMNGDDRFAEVFFDEAEAADVVGSVGDGWRVAMTTLAHERFTRCFRLCMKLQLDLEALIDIVGAGAGPLERQELAHLFIEVFVLRSLLWRDFSRLRAGEPIGHRGSLHKLAWSEIDQRLYDTASRLLGARAILGETHWLHDFLYTRAETIFAGSSEIQRNILAERVLHLPRS